MIADSGSRWLRQLTIVLALGGGTVSCSDDDGGAQPLQDRRGVGQALSVLSGAPQANRSFVVLDLRQPADAAPVASGTSDSNGNYSFSVKGFVNVIIVFPPVSGTGEPRTSGLLFLDRFEVSKNLVDQTDVACVAGVTAVQSGALDPALLTNERIANLEAAARIVIDRGNVDFTSDDSVNAAAAEVRTMTNDGANPPS